MKKYKIIFKYLDLKSSGYKYIYARNKRDAMITFNELYKNYSVEIKTVEEVENENSN